MIIPCEPIVDSRFQRLCTRAYPNHPKGCPNYGKKTGCPPGVPLLHEVYDLSCCYLVINAFDLAEHVNCLRRKHPDWTDQQLRCCLYWQGTARKQLRTKTENFVQHLPADRVWEIDYCPEAKGLNITHTLAGSGIDMEWPPVNTAMQVAFVAGLCL